MDLLPNAITPAFRGLTMGLGAVVADRLIPRGSRPLRWALGMCIASLVPPQMLGLLRGGSLPMALRTPLGIGSLAFDGVVTGLLMGLAASTARGFWWKVPLAGLVARGLRGLRAGADPILWMAPGGPSMPLGWTRADHAIAESLFGLLIGVAIAVCLWIALAECRGERGASEDPSDG